MFFRVNVHVLREMHENEVDEVIYHLEKERKVHFWLAEFN